MKKNIDVLFKNKNGKLVWWKIVIDVIAILFILGTIGTVLNPTYTASITYTTEPIPAVPAKEAVYSVPMSYTYDIGEIIVCGEDVPVGTYTINYESYSSYDTVILNFQKVGDGEHEGSSLSQAEEFECKEGMQLRTWNDDGMVTLTSEKELITEATEEIPAVPSEEITEVLEYDSWLEEWSATSNDQVVNPEELVKYDELKADIDNQMAQ